MYFYGIPRRNQRSKYNSLKEELEDIYINSSYSLNDIAKRYDISKNRVWRLFNKIGIKCRNSKEAAIIREEKLMKYNPENYHKKGADFLRRMGNNILFKSKSLLNKKSLPSKSEKKLIKILNKYFPNE